MPCEQFFSYIMTRTLMMYALY